MAKEKTEFTLSMSTSEPNDLGLDYFLNHDTYLYAENKDLGLIVPISDKVRASEITKTINALVCVKQRVFYNSFDFNTLNSTNEYLFFKVT